MSVLLRLAQPVHQGRPELSRSNECNSCGAPVTWATNDSSGKPAPIDTAPVENGNVVMLGVNGRGEHTYHVLTKADRAEGTHDFRQKFTSHFATCPESKQHRRG